MRQALDWFIRKILPQPGLAICVAVLAGYLAHLAGQDLTNSLMVSALSAALIGLVLLPTVVNRLVRVFRSSTEQKSLVETAPPTIRYSAEDMGVLIDWPLVNVGIREAILQSAAQTPLANFVRVGRYDLPGELPEDRVQRREAVVQLRQTTNAVLVLQLDPHSGVRLFVLSGPGIVSRQTPSLFYAELYDWLLASRDADYVGKFVVAYCLYRREFYEEAEQAIADSTTPECVFLRACSKLRRGVLQSARDGFTNSWDRRLYGDRWARAMHNRGITYLQEGLASEAIPDFLSALELRRRDTNPQGFAYTTNNLAVAFAQRREQEKARQLLNDAREALLADGLSADAAVVAANLSRIDTQRPSLLPDEIVRARAQIRELIGIPDGPFVRRDIRIAHRLIQATSISGDFYRIIPRQDGSVGILLVDVEGHGLVASANALALERALFRAGRNWGTGEARQQLLLADGYIEDELGHVDMAVCMSFLEVDPYGKRIRYAAAGMPFPLLFRPFQSQPETIHAVGMYVGAGYRRTEVYPASAEAQIEDGDVVVLFTDGIPEAMDARGRLFGQDGITAAVFRAGFESAEGIADSIITGVKAHAGSDQPEDDQAVLVIQIGEAPAPRRTGVSTFSVLEGLSKLSFELLNAQDSGLFATTSLKDRLISWANIQLGSEERALEAWNATWEAVQNAIKHGSKAGDVIRIDLKPVQSGIMIMVTQPQRWTDWDLELGSRRPTMELAPTGGVGTLVILRLSDQVSVTENGRCVQMTFTRRIE
jgi:anti-sigma regulatory factor (Ser/Thr protein kinase)/tetratricopeptide (TPR) repeat protein